jgi:hypothetical protein
MKRSAKNLILTAGEDPEKRKAIADLLDYAPREFAQAYHDGEEAEWRTDDIGDSRWALHDDDYEPEDPDGWSEVTYYNNWETRDHRIFRQVWECDRDGNHDIVDDAELYSPQDQELLKSFSYGAHQENIAGYYDWVATHGQDPLGWFYISHEKVQDRWLFGFVNDNGVPRFWKARHLDGDRETTENWNGLPEHVRSFLNLDQNGHTLDVPTWQELEALPDTEMKTARDGTAYAQIRFEDKVLAAQAQETGQRKLIEQARKGATEARREARKSKNWTWWAF